MITPSISPNTAIFVRPVPPSGLAAGETGHNPAVRAPGGQNTGAAAIRPTVNAQKQQESGGKPGQNGASAFELSDEEKARVAELKKRDQEVRAHERAHASAGGRYAGQPSYSFERGPDGRQYAVGGEVSIDASPESGDPGATIRKMETVKRAALAPAQPSGQDRAVAAQADAQRIKAQAELSEKKDEEGQVQGAGQGGKNAASGALLGEAHTAYLASATLAGNAADRGGFLRPATAIDLVV